MAANRRKSALPAPLAEICEELSVRQRISRGEYRNTDVYPSRVVKPRTVIDLTLVNDAEVAALREEIATYQSRLAAYRDACAAYNAKEHELDDKFRRDLEAENGMTDHPKAASLFAKAWENGHSAGHEEVVTHYEDLLELVK